jgi:hypothetical protein
VDQGRQGRDQVDTAVLPALRRQCRSPSAPRACVQPRQLHAHAGDAKTAQPCSLTTCEKLIKIGAKVVSHGRYVTFQMAEVAVSRQMFADICR